MLFHASDLRRGRFSQHGFFYVVTTVTYRRKKFFLRFWSARLLIKSLQESDQLQQTSTVGFVVMPDHLHWLFQLGSRSELSDVVRLVKGNSARSINRELGRIGNIWQSGFHDHALRNEENLKDLMRYIIANPLRAGLADSVGYYPHWDCIYL